MKKFIRFFKRIFSKKSKKSIGMSGLTSIKLNELFLKYPELKDKAIIFGKKEDVDDRT